MILVPHFIQLASAWILNWVERCPVYPGSLPSILIRAYAPKPQNAEVGPSGRSHTQWSPPIVSNQEDSNTQPQENSFPPAELLPRKPQTDYRRRRHCKTWMSAGLRSVLAYEKINENLIYILRVWWRPNTGISTIIK